MLKTKVKASSITNLTDARYFAAWEVEWLGFNLELGNESYIAPQDLKAMKEWVDGVKIVGEFGFQSAEEIRVAADLLELDAIQIGMFSTVEIAAGLKDLNLIKEFVIDANLVLNLAEEISAFSPYCSVFLLNFEKGGLSWKELKDQKSDFLSLLKDLCQKHSILLSIQASPTEIEEIIDEIEPAGFNVKGGEEEKVGVKSFDELDEFFEAIEILV